MPDPQFSKQTIFTAQTGGYYQYRMPGLLVTPAGTLLAATEARQEERSGGSNGHGDYVDIDIVTRRSFDGGLTWDAPSKVADHEQFGPGPCHNFCPIADQQQRCIHALFSFDYARAFYIRSDDDGVSWSAPREITEVFLPYRERFSWTVLSSGLAHSIQLTTGRLVVPIWISDNVRPTHGPGRASTLYSDDGGVTWLAGELIFDNIPSCNEAQLVELRDGRVLINMRNESPEYRCALASSPDGSSHWSVPQLHPTLADAHCFNSTCRMSGLQPHERSRILFSHPDPPTPPDTPEAQSYMWRRQNLTVCLSYDECQSWPIARVVAPGRAGYSDLAALPDGTICCAYEDIPRGYNFWPQSITLARFNLEWLTNGEDSVSN